MYGVLTVGSGEWSILKEPGDSPDDVGRMSVPFPYKSASTYVLMKDMLAVRPDLHITFVGKFGGWHGEKPGLYEDATNPRLAWVVVPKNMADEIGPPYCAGLTHYTSMFSDQTKGALPIDAVVGDLPHYSKQMSLQMTAGKRVVPGIARHETACDSGGYLVSWGKPGRDAWLGQRDCLGQDRHAHEERNDRAHRGDGQRPRDARGRRLRPRGRGAMQPRRFARRSAGRRARVRPDGGRPREQCHPAGPRGPLDGGGRPDRGRPARRRP